MLSLTKRLAKLIEKFKSLKLSLNGTPIVIVNNMNAVDVTLVNPTLLHKQRRGR